MFNWYRIDYEVQQGDNDSVMSFDYLVSAINEDEALVEFWQYIDLVHTGQLVHVASISNFKRKR